MMTSTMMRDDDYTDYLEDLYGNTSVSTCPSGSPITSSSFDGLNSMEYYLR